MPSGPLTLRGWCSSPRMAPAIKQESRRKRASRLGLCLARSLIAWLRAINTELHTFAKQLPRVPLSGVISAGGVAHALRELLLRLHPDRRRDLRARPGHRPWRDSEEKKEGLQTVSRRLRRYAPLTERRHPMALLPAGGGDRRRGKVARDGRGA